MGLNARKPYLIILLHADSKNAEQVCTAAQYYQHLFIHFLESALATLATTLQNSPVVALTIQATLATCKISIF